MSLWRRHILKLRDQLDRLLVIYRPVHQINWCHSNHFFMALLVWSVLIKRRLLNYWLTHTVIQDSCSKLLQNDVVFIWCSDAMLFTLTTRRMSSGAAKSETLEQKNVFFSCKHDVQGVANSDRRRIKIRLRYMRDICRLWTQIDET